MKPTSDSAPDTPTLDPLAAHLQTQQHLHPHRPLHLALQHLERSTGLCPVASRQASSTLSLDPHLKIGRLRRCQLLQLARTLHRLWRQNRPPVSHPFQPA